MSDQPETHASGLLYFIPHWVFEDETLSSTAKLVYALLSGLAHGNSQKTCFPSDAYIASRLKISRKQANECVSELEKLGALSKRNTAHPNAFKKRRIITIHLEIKKSLRSNENVTTDDFGHSYEETTESNENVTTEGNENVTYRNKDHRNKESILTDAKESTLTRAKESASLIARAPHVSVSSSDHEKLIELVGEEMTQRCYERLSLHKEQTPKSKWKKGDYLSIRNWVIDALQEQDVKKSRIDQNASKMPENRIKQVREYIQSHPKKEVLRRAANANLIKIESTHIVRLGQMGGDATIDFAGPGIFDKIDSLVGKLEASLKI